MERSHMVDENYMETHLQFIENAITRMGQNSFQAKAWCVTVVSALLAYFLEKGTKTPGMHDLRAFAIGALVIVFFGVIDAYYLYLERGYRSLYNIVAGLDEESTARPLDMSIPKGSRGFGNYVKAARSISVFLFYLALIVLTALIVFIG